MIYGIASYKRPECKTIDLLNSLGVENNRIFVALQDESEIEKYKAFHKDVNYIVRKADCAAGNRNTLIQRLPKPLVLLDDDLKAFVIRRNGQNFKRMTTADEVENELEIAIEEARLNKCEMIGFSATENNMVARARPDFSYDVLLQGSMLIALGDTEFDENWKMVEDYEISLRIIHRNGHTIRANQISAIKPKNGTNEGGLHERYENNELPIWTRRLGQKYKEFKPNKTFTGGRVKFD